VLFKQFNEGNLNVTVCKERPCCAFNGFEPWGECSKDCGGGTRSRYEKCFCPAFFETPDDSWCSGDQQVETEDCNISPCSTIEATTNDLEEEPVENSDLEVINEPEHFNDLEAINELENNDTEVNNDLGENNCYRGGWGDWSECDEEDGTRWRKELCYCDTSDMVYDDSYCDDLPQVQTESCGTSRDSSCIRPIEYWQQNNIYGKDTYCKPWPISESTTFLCNQDTNPHSSKSTWFEILSLPASNQWSTLAKEYIVVSLNLEICSLPTTDFKIIVEEADWLLHDCEQFSDTEEELAQQYTAVLHNYNTGNLGNLTVSSIEDQTFNSRSFGGYSENTPEPALRGSNNVITIILSIGTVIFVALVIVVFVKYRRYKRRESESIVTYEPEFDLPDPDEELVSGNDFSNGIDDEEDEINYELGELDDVKI